MRRPDRETLRKTVARLGGEGHVSARLRLTERAILASYDARQFSARWYHPMCEMAAERGEAPPDKALFNWRELVPAEAVK